ncbi:MAG: hypothetical protein Q9210_003440 [Variospora velana]
MSHRTFERSRLALEHYDLHSPPALARLQCTVGEFVAFLRQGELNVPVDRLLLDAFCELVADDQVWPLAQAMVPEFRSITIERLSEIATTRNSGSNVGPLDLILLSLQSKGRLPEQVSDQNILTDEFKFMDDRHLRLVEFITAAAGRPFSDALLRHHAVKPVVDSVRSSPAEGQEPRRRSKKHQAESPEANPAKAKSSRRAPTKEAGTMDKFLIANKSQKGPDL